MGGREVFGGRGSRGRVVRTLILVGVGATVVVLAMFNFFLLNSFLFIRIYRSNWFDDSDEGFGFSPKEKWKREKRRLNSSF